MQNAIIAQQILGKQTRKMHAVAIASGSIGDDVQRASHFTIGPDYTPGEHQKQPEVVEFSSDSTSSLITSSVIVEFAPSARTLSPGSGQIQAWEDFSSGSWQSDVFVLLSFDSLLEAWQPTSFGVYTEDLEKEGLEVDEGSPAAGSIDHLTNELRSGSDPQRAQISAQLEKVKSYLPSRTVDRLKRRFEFLFEPEDEEEIRISPGSVAQLLRFLRQDRKFRCPSIFITDRQNVKAIWQASENKIFWIEFEPSGDVTYLAFFPNEKRSDGVERQSALSTVEDVLDRAKQAGAVNWMRK